MTEKIAYAFCACKGAEFYSSDKTRSEKRTENLCNLRQFTIAKSVRCIGSKYGFMSAKGVQEFVNLGLIEKEENPDAQIIFVIDNLLLFRDHINENDFNSLQILGRVVDTLLFEAEVEEYLDRCAKGGFSQ